jgi:Fe2+ transport system protein B
MYLNEQLREIWFTCEVISHSSGQETTRVMKPRDSLSPCLRSLVMTFLSSHKNYLHTTCFFISHLSVIIWSWLDLPSTLSLQIFILIFYMRSYLPSVSYSLSVSSLLPQPSYCYLMWNSTHEIHYIILSSLLLFTRP